MERSMPAVLFLILLNIASPGYCLRDMHITVPQAVLIGDSVRLRCDYDLEQAALYSIKWYRSDEEFYRYVPKEAPPARVFPVPGIHVDVSQSDEHSVSLLSVQRELSGLFRCEVSADAPLFHTDIRSGHMTVAEIPESNPSLTIHKTKISKGEKLRSNCTVGPSYPAANMTWYIHGHQIQNSPITRVSEWSHVDDATGLYYSWSSMELSTPGELSRAGILRVRCLATLYSLYRQSVEHEVTIGPPLGPLDPSRSTQYQEHSQGHVLIEEVSSGSIISTRPEAFVFLMIVITRMIFMKIKFQ